MVLLPHFSIASLSKVECTANFTREMPQSDRVTDIATAPMTKDEDWKEFIRGQLLMFNMGVTYYELYDCREVNREGKLLCSRAFTKAVQNSVSTALLFNQIIGTGLTATNTMNMTMTGNGDIRDGGGGGEGASLLSLSGRGEDHGGGGRGRNDKCKNDEDIIHVRRKAVDVGGVGEGLGTTGLDQQQRLHDDKDKEKDKDKDKDKEEDDCP